LNLYPFCPLIFYPQIYTTWPTVQLSLLSWVRDSHTLEWRKGNGKGIGERVTRKWSTYWGVWRLAGEVCSRSLSLAWEWPIGGALKSEPATPKAPLWARWWAAGM